MPDHDALYYTLLASNILQSQSLDLDAPTCAEEQRRRLGQTIYRNNFRSGYTKVLSETFPVVQKLVGADFFDFLAGAYLKKHPPTKKLLRDYGKYLPDFLMSLSQVNHLPYLVDVAKVELAYLSVYHQKSIAAMEPNSLAGLLAEAPENFSFGFVPAFDLLKSDTGAGTIWQHQQQQNMPEKLSLKSGYEWIMITRPKTTTLVEIIPPTQGQLLENLRQGRPLGTALAALDITPTDQQLVEILQFLMQANIIASATLHR